MSLPAITPSKHLRRQVWKWVRRINVVISLCALAMLWLNTGRDQFIIDKYPGRQITHLAFTPDSRILIGLDSYFTPSPISKTLHVWDTNSGRLLWDVLVSEDKEVPPPAISRDGSVIAAVGVNLRAYVYTIRFYETRSGRLLREVQTTWRVDNSSADKLNGVCLSPDGRVAALYDNTNINFYDRQTGTHTFFFVRSIRERNSEIDSLSFAGDGKKLIVTARPIEQDKSPGKIREGSVSLWDIETGNCDRIFEAQKNTRFEAALSPDGTHLVTFDANVSCFSLYDVRTGKQTKQVYNKCEKGGRYGHLFVRSDNQTVSATRWTTNESSGMETSEFFLWNTWTNETKVETTNTVRADFAVSPTGQFVANEGIRKGSALAFIINRQSGGSLAAEGKVGW